MDAGARPRYVPAREIYEKGVEVVLFRLALLFLAVAIVSILAAGCGSDDSSLEELGGAVQSTRVAQATLDAVSGAVSTLPAGATPDPAATPDISGELEQDVRRFGVYAGEAGSLFTFLDVRLATEPTLGDVEGNLAAGWLDACCATRLATSQSALRNATILLDEIQGAYLREGAAGHLLLIPAIRDGLIDVETLLDSLAPAETVEEATLIVESGVEASGALDEAIAALASCCGSSTPDASPEPTT